MKKLILRAAVSSALLIVSSLASANTINFTNAADAVIAAELQPFITSFENDPNPDMLNLYNDIVTRMPAYSISNYSGIITDEDVSYFKREVALSELSNSEVSFTNTNLGLYQDCHQC